MSSVIWIQSAIWSNRFKTLILILLFPVLLFWVFFVVFFFLNYSGNKNGNNAQEFYTNAIKEKLRSAGNGISEQESLPQTEDLSVTEAPILKKFPDCSSNIASVCIYRMYVMRTFEDVSSIFILLGPVLLVWCLIAFTFHRSIIFSFTQAKPITRAEYPELYNIVENLCISRWLPTPNIGILEDDSYNAFAVWWNPKKAWIVFSRWIINKLNRQEIEAVAAHELTHIMNKDWLLMVTVIVFIWAVAAIGEILVRVAWRGGSSNSRNSWWQWLLLLVGLVLLVLGYMVLPFVQLAISRKREYLADAGSVELTHDKLSMISALEKIQTDSRIESITKRSVSALCIADPFKSEYWVFFGKLQKEIVPKSSFFSEFFSTHPSIENRIELLSQY